MTGGISAIRGFDFQATVILDLLIQHFERFGAAASVRPEGTDDLDLDDGLGNQTFVQIKKRHEDLAGAATGEVWSLNDAVDELLGKTLNRLRGNIHRQVWLIGDGVSDELRALVDSAAALPTRRAALLKAAHLLARKSSVNLAGLDSSSKRTLERWDWGDQLSQPPELARAAEEMASAFQSEAGRLGVASEDAAAYVSAATRFTAELESALPRISLRAGYGQEREVAERVTTALQSQLGTTRSVAEDTLFRNLRGFISDVSKMPGRRFDKAAFEDELVSVWPMMIPVRLPPAPETGFVDRSEVASRLAMMGGGVLEVLGPSGSGKTSLAGDAVRAFEAQHESGLAFYIEAASGVSVRNIVVGLAFRLRRFGVISDTGVMFDGHSTSEQVITAFGTAIATLSRPVCAFVDFVAGGAEDPTGVDLAKLVSQASGVTPNFRLVVLAQETPFRNLSEFDRQARQIQTLALPGLTFPEFLKVVELNEVTAERQALYVIYMRITAGRVSGLLPKLATALAKQVSVSAMEALATLPPESMLESADMNRFFRMPAQLQPAAGMLSCFALPFSRNEATEAFRAAPVGAAIAAMRDLGLLRRRDELTFEMHETVRAGLETAVAVNAREQAHTNLARWYAAQGHVAAEVLHLTRAGRDDEAKARARESFMAGANWSSLVGYVRDNCLLSGSEVTHLLVACDDAGVANLLLPLFDGVADGEATAQILLSRLSAPTTTRNAGEYSLRIAIANAIVRAHLPAMSGLISLALNRDIDAGSHDSWISAVGSALRQRGSALDPESLALFSTGDDDRKTRLLPLLLQDGRLPALSLALEFVSATPTSLYPRTQANLGVADKLRLNTLASVQAFLAAIPSKPMHELLMRKSPLLQGVTPLIWANRDALRRYVPDALRDPESSQAAQQNGIRVLAALADERTASIADELPRGLNAPSTLAQVLMPWLADPDEAERTLLDVHADLNERTGCLIVLSGFGTDFGRLLNQLVSTDPTYAALWQTIILPMCARHPFVEAVPLIKARLEENPDYLAGSSIALGLGALASPAVTEFLVWALQRAGAYTRMAAALALTNQRSSHALSGLEQAASSEVDQAIGVNIVSAMVASHPTTCVAVTEACERFPAAAHWRFILAGRIADESMADDIVSTSTSSTTYWRVRRAAILAAGRLPFGSALAHMVAPLLAERSTYPDDQSGDLGAHHALTFLLGKGVTSAFSSFASQREDFIGFLSPLVEHVTHQGVYPDGTPIASHASAWVYDRLLAAGHPINPRALSRVASELHVPILQAALLRSLRLSGRVDVVISTIANATTLWLAVRCVIEAFRVREADLALCDSVEEAASRCSFLGNLQFDGILRESLGARRRGIAMLQTSPQPASASAPAAVPERATTAPLNPRVSSDRALAALADVSIAIEINAPLVVVPDSDDSLHRLALALHPAGDYTSIAVEAPASLRLTGRAFAVGDARTSHTDNRAALRAALRPAVAAASSSPGSVAWHESLLREPGGRPYPLLYLEALVAQSCEQRFFGALAESEDVLVPLMFQSDSMASKVSRYTDQRLIAIVLKFQAAGDDAFFNGMCQLLLAFTGSAVDPALSAMLRRWESRFDLTQRFLVQHADNQGLWRGFARLSEHPRLTSIPDWDTTIQRIAETELADFHRQSLLRVLERSSRSYVFLEETLSKTSNFIHFRWDEVDRLDDTAHRLFREGT